MSDIRSILRRTRDFVRNAVHRASIPLRRLRYVNERNFGVLSEGAVGRAFELDDESAVGARRIEIGSGPYPRPGFLHIDIGADARHLEFKRTAWELPFPSDWASEISAIHSLEHLPPPLLAKTLAEWYRVLSPDGKVHVSVPNTPHLMERFTSGSIPEKWQMTAAILGMYAGPDTPMPDDLVHPADHKILFDFPMLRNVLEEAGFSEVADNTQSLPDRHTRAWRNVVDHYSLVVTAKKPS